MLHSPCSGWGSYKRRPCRLSFSRRQTLDPGPLTLYPASMCGRFARKSTQEVLADWFGVEIEGYAVVRSHL